MAKDFSFLFYPGDVLRETQFFSPQQKSCYLDILTSHIENIRFSYDFLMKITKGLNDAERKEFLAVFEKDDSGYFLNWAVDAIEKRAAYLQSRSNNKSGKTKSSSSSKNPKSYDYHMENKNEKENKNKEEREIIYPFDSEEFMTAWNLLIKEPKWKKKSNTALQASLEILSKHSHSDAVQMIKNSIAGGWQGIFEIKPTQNGTKKTGHDIDRAMELADKVLRGEINTNF